MHWKCMTKRIIDQISTTIDGSNLNGWLDYCVWIICWTCLYLLTSGNCVPEMSNTCPNNHSVSNNTIILKILKQCTIYIKSTVKYPCCFLRCASSHHSVLLFLKMFQLTLATCMLFHVYLFCFSFWLHYEVFPAFLAREGGTSKMIVGVTFPGGEE